MDRFNADSKEIFENYILAFAIDKYADSRFHGNDKRLSEIEIFVKITTNYFFGFDTSRVEIVSNEAATKINILEKITRTVTKRINTSNSNLIIYFSGDGYFDYDKGHIVSYDANKDDVRTFISYDRIIGLLKGSPFRHIFIISDACHAGRIFNISKPFHGDYDAFKKHSRCIITSGLREEVNYEKYRKLNHFSTVLNKILVRKRNLGTKTIEISQIQGELKNLLVPDSETDETHYTSRAPDIGHLKVEGFENVNGAFTFFPKEILYSEGLNHPHSESFLDYIRNEPISNKKGNNKEVKERSNSAFVPIILLFFIVFLGINSVQRAEKYYNVPYSEGAFLPRGLLDSTVVRKIPKEIEAAIKEQPLEEIPMPGQNSPINKSNHTTTRFVRFDEKGNIVYVDEQNLNLNKRKKTTQRADSTNVVFVGSFNDTENAEYLISNLKSIGYKEAEVIMKENLPYAVAVSGFYSNRKEAKAKVLELKKKGFDVYLAKTYWREIYRK